MSSSTTSATSTRSESSRANRSSGLALTALSVGGFGIGLTEFVIAGSLMEIGTDLGVSVSGAGQLVGVYALAVAPGALILTPLLIRRSPKWALVALLGFFIVGNVLSAWAPGYEVMYAGRIVAALAHGGYFGIGAVLAGSLVFQSTGVLRRCATSGDPWPWAGLRVTDRHDHWPVRAGHRRIRHSTRPAGPCPPARRRRSNPCLSGGHRRLQPGQQPGCHPCRNHHLGRIRSPHPSSGRNGSQHHRARAGHGRSSDQTHRDRKSSWICSSLTASSSSPAERAG